MGTKKTRVWFQDPTRPTPQKAPRKEKYPSKWMSWDNLKPVDKYYTGAIQGATARKHGHRHQVQMKEHTNRTQQQRETSSAATEANLKNNTSNRLFQDRHLSKKMKIKEKR